MNNLKPNIFDYNDYRSFLKSLFEFEKARGLFSYSIFAERAGFQARSYLRTVISGKRNLTEPAVEKTIVGFNLSPLEGEALRCLVRFNQCSKFEKKHFYWEQFAKLRPRKNKSVLVDEYMYLARMAYPLLHVILKQSHIQKEASELSRLTGLSKAEVSEGLETLEKIGAISLDENRQVQTFSNHFKTKDDVPSVAVQKFHSNVLKKSIEALDLPVQCREFQSMMVALSEEEFQHLKKKIKLFMDELEEQFSGERLYSEKVYAINLNLVPMTPDFIRTETISKASQKSDELQTMSQTLKENIL